MKSVSSSIEKFKTYICLCLIVISTAIIIHSCKKDSPKTQSGITNIAVSQAESWYENTYPVNSNTATGKLTTQSINTPFDFSQIIKPDWGHAATYTRLGESVIELPLDPSHRIHTAFTGGISNNSSGAAIYPKQNSRSSFIILNNGKSYSAYIMTILADPSYMKNDTTKLALNTYRKRDVNFSGMVLYFTPKGQFVSGYEFSNGKLVTAAPAQSSQSKVIQSLNPQGLKTNVDEPPYDCTFYYAITYDDDGNIEDQTFLYAVCVQEDGGGSGSGSSGSGSSGSGGSTGGGVTVSPPPSCVPSGSGGSGDASVTKQVIDVAEPPPGGGDDGGMPPPDTNCNVTTVTTADTINNPCLQLIHVDSVGQFTIGDKDYTALIKDTYTGHEYGNEDNVSSIPPTGNYNPTPITTDFGDAFFTPTFTWDDINGYTININHEHPAGNAPSPKDVFDLLTDSWNANLVNAGAANLNYYKMNASITTITTYGTYIITIKNYSQLQQLYNQQSMTSWNSQYLSIAGDNNASSEVALLTLFGSAINVFKASENSSNYSILGINSSGTVTVVTCPND